MTHDSARLHRPNRERIEQTAEELGLSLNDEELEDYTKLLFGALDDLETVLSLPEPTFGMSDVGSATRTDIRPPGDDPLNLWIRRCTVERETDGPLSGERIGLKDSIAVAGCEMTCGSRLLEGYVPQIDATVVDRLLDAGATITGKLNMESFAWSGSSDISDYGTVPNPHDPDRLAGGSSSGSGAAVAVGACDISLGGDQGGSIRIPASWCGVVGLKPTTGLVPYTGVFPLDPTIDHVGPLTRTVADAATTLEVLAGEDVRDGVRMDPRQPRGVSGDKYGDAVGEPVDGMSVGILEEGFDWDAGDPRVDSAARDAISRLESRGVSTSRVSVPTHRHILPLLTAMEIQGGYRTMAESGVGTHHTGWYWQDLHDTLRKFRAGAADELPVTAKSALLIGEYLQSEYGVEFYARAKNIALDMKRQFDRALETHDAIVMPTIPMLPYERDASLNRIERLGRIVENHRNTATFDHTHHPALTVPCDSVEGLPIGLQLVGAQFDETSVLRLGAAVETDAKWELTPPDRYPE